MMATGTPQVIIGVKCDYCSKFRSPREMIRMSGGVKMCWRCWQWHQVALKVLAGVPPPGCQECGVTFAELKAATGGDIRMYVHVKDGIYQILCKTCSDKYVPKRVDLYGHTAFGRSQKLTG
jgi:hypothetical protein